MKAVRLSAPVLALLATGSLAHPGLLNEPSRPRNLEAVADGPYAVDLDWRRSSGSDGYYVYRDGDRVADSDRSDYRDEGLQPATTYVYRVSAFNRDGESDLSDPVQVTADAIPGPTTPADLVATALGPNRIDLVWSASEAEAGMAYYRVLRADVEVGTTSGTSYQDGGLAPETTYEYRVSAVDVEGSESELSEPAFATTFPGEDTIPPAPPTGLRLSGGP